MKKLIGKYVAAACGACLLLFTPQANAAPAPVHFGKQMVQFDNLSSGSSVPYGYGWLGWYNFYALDPSTLDLVSGYLAGLKSPNNVILNSSSPGVVPTIAEANLTPNLLAYSEIYSSRYAFILNSAYLTAAWNDNLQVTVRGYYYGRVAFTRTYTLSAVRPTLVTFPSQLVTWVDFYSSGGTHHVGYAGLGTQFAMDNLTYVILPIPVLLF